MTVPLRDSSLHATPSTRRRYRRTVDDAFVAPSMTPTTQGGAIAAGGAPVEERLVQVLPQLRAHLARGGGEVDDLAQEAALRALRAKGAFDARRELWPWLRVIADRVRFDHRRRRAEERHEALDALPDHVDPAARPERHDLDEAERVAALLAGLPAPEREVLLRHHVDGEPIVAIAAGLGLPVGTVKSHLSRARRRAAAWSRRSGDGADDAAAERRREVRTRAVGLSLLAALGLGLGARALLSRAASGDAPVVADPTAQSHPSHTLPSDTGPAPFGVFYGAVVTVEHVPPSPPRVALVVHEPRRVVAWSLDPPQPR
jgi:RNA polymerase sigma factor (sigma-70 family)